jgi:hypothetical protein
MHPVERYGSDDARSMVANNTSAFNCRPDGGSAAWSEHAYGRALDVNTVQNPGVPRLDTPAPEVDRDAVHLLGREASCAVPDRSSCSPR